MNLRPVLDMFASEDWERLAADLLEALSALERAGASFAAIASNTPHIVWDRVRPASPLPLISIVETVCREARARQVKRPALLGTSLTMRADYYHRALRQYGMEAVSPNPEEQALIQHLLDTEIEKGVFRDETRRRLLSIVERMRAEDGIDAVILGCTELPLILSEPAYGVPFLNTTNLHVKAIVERCQGQG